MAQPTEEEINARVEELADTMLQRRLAFSRSQALERARDIINQEVSMQKSFEEMKDDPSRNPQQRPRQVTNEQLKAAGGMLTGDELPKDVSLAELLKGRNARK